ncbi:LOW QUALITY PROTEIN: transferrin receptor 1b [Cottoperca gobio]|uniref:LOW QUALITY PROTEIN: transferrin receptor 1b n=1 Tax=Cottoperca gobio TaxID=56716 RepID=A0A6J2RX94_COTGO|nr:LOW QUALITY PROTEIN: transferrin receptor protein 1-like [Cottoperca gobio]
MDRVRSAFNSVIKSERYSRFTLQPAEDGERHVEVKLSDDATEAEDQAGGSPSFRPAPPSQGRTTLCYLALATLLIFVTGYVLGYLSHRETQLEQVSCGPELEETPAAVAPAPGALMDWKDVTQLLTQKLTSQDFDKSLRDFDLPSRSAGSDGDKSLANRIFDEFKQQEMDPWTDIHYVQLQKPDSKRPNRVLFGSEDFKPTGYLAYSAPGKAEGKLVYGNYGRQEDLEVLQKKNIELKDCVLLLRAGKISFAEQVDNAARKEASAVLIYPDAQDYKYVSNTELYGHVHLGSGDPYTPGFPSFNHTQFPPTQSSGLPKIPAQTITGNMALALLQKIQGPESDESSGFKGGFTSVVYNLGGSHNITVEVNNVLVSSEIHNVFGVIKGFIEPDHYVVLGAQRDSWGKGYAKATVGTSILIELAKAVREMVENDGFRPRRSLVFASWSGGEYGSVGATEWLEGYMSSIDRRVFTYINLDGVVMGRGSFMASASPLLYSLLESTMKEVKSPLGSGTVYDMVGTSDLKAKIERPMSMDDPAYPFLAMSGIPSISFHFISPNKETYSYYGTNLDNKDDLDFQTGHHTSEMVAVAAQFAGQMALRLVHDHLVRLDVNRYSNILNGAVVRVIKRINQLSQAGHLKVNANWLIRARGSFQRAARSINTDILNTDLNDKEACRILNARLMSVEHNLLSAYVSPIETPFRHLLLGRGSHTLASIGETTGVDQLHMQLALATWNLQGCANGMVGNIWDIDEEI